MNLLVTGAWGNAKEHIADLEKSGHNVCFLQFEKDELPVEYDWVEGIIGNGIFLYHSIEKFKNLKYIQLTSAGFDRVPMDYVKSHGIEIHNARGVYSIPMAEFAVSGVLDIYKQKSFFFNSQKEHLWEKKRDLLELFGKTVCIFGCGSVGAECAKRFKAFGTKITGVDIFKKDYDFFDEVYELDEVKNAISSADIVVLTLPLTEQTKDMFNEQMFSIMKENSVLVNIARGGIVDTNALINALKTKLLGAVLDVFCEEPLAENSPLWDMENVIITPHNSFVGDGNEMRIFSAIKQFL